MVSGLLINIMLVVLATLCFAFTIYYYRLNLFNDSKQNLIVLIMGLSVTVWNAALAGYGFSADIVYANIHFAILIAAFDVYVFSISIWVASVAKVKGFAKWFFFVTSAIVSIGDLVLFGIADLRNYVEINGRLAYTTNFSRVVIYHFFYIAFYTIVYICIIVKHGHETTLKRKKRYIIQIIGANLFMVALSFPDTFFPLFGFVSIPTSGLGAMISFVLMMYFSDKANTFAMSRESVLDAIYEEASIAILVVNYRGVIESFNNYSIKLLGEIEAKKTGFEDIFDCSEEQLKVLLSGQSIDEHIVAKETGLSCNIKATASYDDYGELYGIALIVSDATAEERILEQQVMLNRSEELTSQLVHVLSKTIDAKDHYTNGHSERVAKYSVMIGKQLGFDDKKLKLLEYAALLHDVGKIGVRDEVLNKTGKLTDEEFNEIKRHPIIGAEILSGIKSIPEIEVGARWHHERYSGGGYPDNMKGNDIKEVARIIAVADAYDAMASTRSYRDCLPQDVVRSEIEKGKGTQFDPVFADIMLYLMDEDTQYVLHE